MELYPLLLLELMAKAKAASENNHGNKVVFCTETSHLLADSTICVAGPKFLKLVLITDDPILLAALVTVFRSQNTEARTLKVSECEHQPLDYKS